MRKGLIGLCATVMLGAFAVEDAEARRLGGARSSGVQRSVPNNPPAATPAKPAQQQAAPNQQAGQQAAPAQQAQPQPSGLSRWMPMLGGLALGGLLGYLFAGNGLVGILLLVLLAVGAVLLFRTLARRGAPQAQPMQYAGMRAEPPVMAPPPQSYGTDVAPAASRLPAGFDAASFLRGAKMNFVKLQLANDQSKLDEIREFTTDDLFAELERDIAERHGNGQQTDVEALDAQLVDLATEGDRHWASVRFSGRVRETRGADPVEFAEVWNLVKPADGSSGWLLAGIQQMH